jgi:hypothetical protein
MVANVNTEKGMVRERVTSWTATATIAMGAAVILCYLVNDVFAIALGLSLSTRVALSATALVAGYAVLILIPTEVGVIAWGMLRARHPRNVAITKATIVSLIVGIAAIAAMLLWSHGDLAHIPQ